MCKCVDVCVNVNKHALTNQVTVCICRCREDPANTRLVCKAISGTMTNRAKYFRNTENLQ